MFGLFKKKSEKEKLHDQYNKLMKEAHELSKINRKQSDQKVYEAEQVMQKLEKMI
ncbi:MAG: Lacal_2735 family protein [Flavobacteriaceae bacterium]